MLMRATKMAPVTSQADNSFVRYDYLHPDVVPVGRNRIFSQLKIMAEANQVARAVMVP